MLTLLFSDTVAGYVSSFDSEETSLCWRHPMIAKLLFV